MSVLSLTIKLPDAEMAPLVPSQLSTDNKGGLLQYVSRAMRRYYAGQSHLGVPTSADLALYSEATRASCAITLNAVVATNAIVLNGTTLTCVNSGATSVQFNKGATDTLTAVNIAAAINSTSAPAGIVGVFRATSSAAVVTVECISPGIIGNSITATGTATRFSLTGAGFFAGGLNGTVVKL